MSKYWSTLVSNLTPYIPGEQPGLTNLIKLNTNENPYAPSPTVMATMQEHIGEELRLYPDPDASALKAAIAGCNGLSPAQVFTGNGSDEVLAHIFQALLKHEKPILFPDITYSFYPVYCGLYDVEYQAVALTETFEIDLNAYQLPNGGIIFPNPNAPTGIGLPLSAIETLLKRNSDSVVVIDEAYVDFGGESAVRLIDRCPNLLVVQTFSKSRSLAGMRIGFAMGHEKLIEALERVKNSFNSYPLDRLAIAAGVAAINDRAYFVQTCQKVIATRSALAAELRQLGFEVLPSKANFLFVRHPEHEAATLASALREKSVLVRHFPYPRIEQFLRISIGTDDECETLVAALHAIL